MTDEEDLISQPVKVAQRMYSMLLDDLDRLETIDAYLHGDHPEPYMPDTADAEYKLLARRAVTNHCPLLVDTPAQALYVDGFRRGTMTATTTSSPGERRNLPEWRHFEESRLAARQDAVQRAALGFGHSFVHTGKDSKGRIISRGLSPLKTVALYEDAANDDNAVAVLHIRSSPISKDDETIVEGKAWLWDRTNEYDLRWDKGDKWRVKSFAPHGLAGENPVTRFAASVDLDGRTVGVVEPYLRIQDRINQTIFDLLVAQTFGSFKTRWATGMAPPMQMEPVYVLDENGDPVRDDGGQPVVEEWRPRIDPATGNPMPAAMDLNAKRFLFGEDDSVRFGTLDETPLGPYVEAVDLAVRHLSALSQTPPHHLLGQIANLSAEALQAAETALSRKVDGFKAVFGESWERVFRMALILSGEAGGDDMTGQVIWRDMGAQALSKSVDALVKLKDIGVPERGLWPRVPGTTQGELSEWEALYEEQGSLGIDRSTREQAMSSMEEGFDGDDEQDPGGPPGF